jgi:hypothetical protein
MLMRDFIAFAGIGFALLIAMLGGIITFVPGADSGFYCIGAIAAAIGLLSTRWRVRVLALFWVVTLGVQSWWCHLGGLRYQEFLRQQGYR